MIIYNTNFSEKLFGYATSRDVIKYNTQLCDLLDDPIVGAEIDLAINFNKAINGNDTAREDFTNTLVLSSGIFDVGTVEFWKHKMMTYPIFKSEVRRIVDIFYNFDNIPRSDNTFRGALKRATEDCLNSPCNIFAPMSDSIGSLTRVPSLLTSTTTLPVGTLKDTLRSVTGGVDHMVFNRLPAVFQSAVAEISYLTSSTWSSVLSTIMGKETLEETVKKAETGTLRTVANGQLYTPDVSAYFLFSELSTNLATSISQDLAGCFRRYQFQSEYNPYSSDQNRSTPGQLRSAPVNGDSCDQSFLFQNINVPLPSTTNSAVGYSSLPQTTQAQAYDPNDVVISPSIVVGSKYDTARNIDVKYTVFGGWTDTGNKIIWVDDITSKITGNKNDDYTMEGTVNFGRKKITPSWPGTTNIESLVSAMNNRLDSPYLNEGYARAYIEEPNTNQDLTKVTGRHNHGIAINYGFIRRMTGTNITNGQIAAAQRANKIYGVVTLNGKTSLVQMIDHIGTLNGLRVDFTPYAFYKITGKYPGTNNLESPTPNSLDVKRIGDWREVKYKINPAVGDMEFRIALGTPEQILQQLQNQNSSTSGAGTGTVGKGTGNVSYVSGFSAKTRNKPVLPQLLNILQQAATRVGVNLIITSGGQDRKGEGTRRTGSTRHDGGRAVDVIITSGKVQLDSNKPSDIPLLESFARAAKESGIRSVGMGPGYMGGNVMHLDIASPEVATVWGKDTKRANAPSWLVRAMGYG
jgi:hypothetical protein